ncbi:hypothetical protein GCM10027294_33610 [Marinactinospora endophytica]
MLSRSRVVLTGRRGSAQAGRGPAGVAACYFEKVRTLVKGFTNPFARSLDLSRATSDPRGAFILSAPFPGATAFHAVTGVDGEYNCLFCRLIRQEGTFVLKYGDETPEYAA